VAELGLSGASEPIEVNKEQAVPAKASGPNKTASKDKNEQQLFDDDEIQQVGNANRQQEASGSQSTNNNDGLNN
jgi:hypothetical protein